MRPIRHATSIAIALLILPLSAAAQTWRLVDVQRVEPTRVEGRGGDFITYAPVINFTPPPTLTIGQSIDITASATYSYGTGTGANAGGGRPKSLSIVIDVPNGNKSQRFPLVPNTCTGTGTQPAALPDNGNVGPVSTSGRLTAAESTTRSFTIAVTVSANIFCFEPEAGGTAGLRATYEQGGPSVNNPPQAEIYIYDPDKIVTPGQIVMLKAKVRDEDPPTSLTYTWTLTNPENGQFRRVVKRGTRVIRWTVGEAPKYRIELSVTDTGGLTGDAPPVDVVSQKPTIDEFKVADSSQQEITVAPYWNQGTPAARRGDWIDLEGRLKNFNRELHCVRLYIDGVRTGTTSPVHPDGWRPMNVGFDGVTYKLTLSVPPDVAAGKHTIELGLNRRKPRGSPNCDTEVDREAINDDLFVLFNAFPTAREADPSVNAGRPLSDAGAQLYSLGEKDFGGFGELGVHPSDPNTLRISQQVLEGLGPALGKGPRADAVAVATALTEKSSTIVHGMWDDKVLAAVTVETLPWNWHDARQIHEEYVRTGRTVQYGQCWVFGTILAASLRSVGIPARMVTMRGSAHDTSEPWGASQGVNGKDPDGDLYGDGWNFHVWVEAWIPSRNSTSGWVALDATMQGRAGDRSADPLVAAPALSDVLRVPHLELPKPYADGDDAVFVFTEANLPSFAITVDCECKRPPKAKPDDPRPPCAASSNCRVGGGGYGVAREVDFMACINDRARRAPYGSRTGNALPILDCLPLGRTGQQAVVVAESGSLDNHIAAYAVPRPFYPIFTQRNDESLGDRLWRTARTLVASLLRVPVVHAQAPASAVDVTVGVPERVPLQRAVSGNVAFRNLPDNEPATLIVRLVFLPDSLSGGAPAGMVTTEVVHQERQRVTPANRSYSGTIQIPADALRKSGDYELQVGLNGIGGAKHRITVEGLPLILTVPPSVALGATFEVRATLTNTLAGAVQQAALEVRLPKELESTGPLRVTEAALAAGRTLDVRATVRAAAAGTHLVRAVASGSAGPSRRTVEMIIQGPRLLAVRGLPVIGAAAGAEVAVTAQIGNPDRADVRGVVATLTPPDGVEVVGSPTQRVDQIAGQRVSRASWRVRAKAAGTYSLKVAAAAGDLTGAGSIGLLVGANDFDDLPMTVAKPEPVPVDPGEDASDASLAAEDFEDDLTDPSAPATAAAGGGGGGGGAGGGGSSGGGRSMLNMPSSVWLIGGLGLACLVLLLAIVVVVRRRSQGED